MSIDRMTTLVQQPQIERRHHTNPNTDPPTDSDSPISQSSAHIPIQMPQTIDTMVHKRPSNQRLDSGLNSKRPSSKSCNNSIEIPAKVWSNEVGDAEDVEAARENETCDAVGDGADGGDLGAVDC